METQRKARRTIGRFELLRTLGRGGMGQVYLGFDPDLERFVAIKVAAREVERPLFSAVLESCLVKEARAMASLVHPNVLTVLEIGREEGRPFVVMELAENDLAEEVSVCPDDWRRTVGLFLDAGEGLAAAHRAGLVHRDFKPSNVLIDEAGRVRVSDFGMSSQAGTSLGAAEVGGDTDVFAGTLRYMAPEQHLGEPVSAAADQFSFCVALYEALFGEHPFSDGDYRALVGAVVSGAARTPTLREVPLQIARVIAKGLSLLPADRYASMRVLLSELAESA